MGMKVGSGAEAVKSEPNVVPMIDVMLVLLIIFMVVTPALAAGFQAVPPSGINLKIHPEEDSDQVLGIDRDGQYFLNKRPLQNDKLAETLKSIYDVRTIDKILYIKADKDLEYVKVLDAMDIASRNGVRVVGAVSDQVPNTESSVAGDAPDPTTKK
ncbi:MAG: biopolymer transporter ExbD [Gemmatimonadetes bacterium]|nr:biopolymer transporter ExbD [Gemmatimonadota bacterium]MCC6773560.1 biopolymer transporter ExbD [Gemmatimonadaceae bacterium]